MVDVGHSPFLAGAGFHNRVPAEAADREVGIPVAGGEDADAVRAFGCGGRNRQIGGCTGYTWPYLPARSCRAPEFKNVEAIRAIFAARMAFSSLDIRSRLKYGPRAFRRACSSWFVPLWMAMPDRA